MEKDPAFPGPEGKGGPEWPVAIGNHMVMPLRSVVIRGWFFQPVTS